MKIASKVIGEMQSLDLDRNAASANNERERAETIDLRGLKCPLPVLRTRKALARLPLGQSLVILADDPLAPLDLAHLCRSEGHEAAPPEPLEGGGWRFAIRKGAGSGEGAI